MNAAARSMPDAPPPSFWRNDSSVFGPEFSTTPIFTPAFDVVMLSPKTCCRGHITFSARQPSTAVLSEFPCCTPTGIGHVGSTQRFFHHLDPSFAPKDSQPT